MMRPRLLGVFESLRFLFPTYSVEMGNERKREWKRAGNENGFLSTNVETRNSGWLELNAYLLNALVSFIGVRYSHSERPYIFGI